MGVAWTLTTVALAVAAAAGWAAADEAVQRRGPAMGFMGTRGKKAPSMGFAAMRGKKDAALTPFFDLYEPFGEDKRAMGFMGMRGKKEQLLYEPDYDFDVLNYADKRAPSMGFAAMRGKKAPSGFMGMRGKKGLYGGDYVDDLLVEDWPPREEGPDKRAPAAGFFGTRGKKMPQGSSFFGMRGKKGPSGFVGMRGKKAPASGFMGVRGKKDSDDLQSLLELLSERADRSKRDEQTQLTGVSDATMEATAPRASSQ